MSNGAFLYEVSGVHEPSRALWTIVTIHVTTWCLPKLTMLWADYAKLGVTSLVLGLAVVILITMDLTSSLYKELEIIVFAGTFRATSTKKMIIGDLPEISVLRACYTNLRPSIDIVDLLVSVLLVMDYISLLDKLFSG